jgi:hypothetical protein
MSWKESGQNFGIVCILQQPSYQEAGAIRQISVVAARLDTWAVPDAHLRLYAKADLSKRAGCRRELDAKAVRRCGGPYAHRPA